MLWQYRTIVFEFSKDGLLGDKYLDDEVIEKTLNEQGAAQWELVNVTMIQEGLLAVLKRPRGRSSHGGELQDSGEEPAPPIPAETDRVTARQIQQEEREHIQHLEQQRKQAMRQQERDLIGDIKIS